MSIEIKSFDDLENHLLQSRKKIKAAFVAPSDMKTLQAVLKASDNNLIEPIFIGDEELIHKKTKENQLDISGIEVLDFKEPYRALETACMLAIQGEIDLIIKGKYNPPDFIEKLFYDNNQFCNVQKVHHVALCKTKEYQKFLFLTDGFVHCQPNVATKSNIIDSTVKLVHKFELSLPKVALLTAVEVVYKQMPATVEAFEIQKKFSENKKACIVEGPISFDIAIDKQAAIAKGLTDSVVAGDTDIMVAPNIGTGNGMYKAISLFADAEIAGIIIGGRVPVVVPTQIDSIETRYNSILLGLLACTKSK